MKLGAEPPPELVTDRPKSVNTVREIKDLTDELALDSTNKKSKRQIWTEVKKIADPYIKSQTPFDGLTEKQVNNR